MGDMLEKRQKQKEVLRRIRKSAAKITSEFLELELRCSVTKRDFVVLFERNYPDKAYKMVRTITSETASYFGSSSLSATPTLDIDIDEIECSSIKCPYCEGGRWHLVKCGCGKLSCAGGVKDQDGKYLHICPWCETEGYVEGEIEVMGGRRLNRDGILPSEGAKQVLPPSNEVIESQ